MATPGRAHPGAPLRQDTIGAVDCVARRLRRADRRPAGQRWRGASDRYRAPLGVSHATAIKTVSRLKRAGMATARPIAAYSYREGPRAGVEGARPPQARCRSTARGGRSGRGRRSRRRGDRALRLGGDAAGILPVLARSVLSCRVLCQVSGPEVPLRPQTPAMTVYKFGQPRSVVGHQRT